MKILHQGTYEQLGNLFYSIAAADKYVAPEEIQKLKEAVQKEWVPLQNTTDEFGSDEAHYIFIEFEFQLEKKASAKETWESFRDYYKEHETLFTDDLRELIMKTSIAIADAFSGMNKSELTAIAQLRKLFNK